MSIASAVATAVTFLPHTPPTHSRLRFTTLPCVPQQADLKGPLPLPPGLVAQRLRAVRSIAADLAKALAAKEAKTSARGFAMPQHLANGSNSRRWQQEFHDSGAGTKGGAGAKTGGGGSRGGGARGGGGGAAGSGRSRGASTARQRGFYTDPDEDEIYYVSDSEAEEEDPDSEYDDSPHRGGGRGRRSGGGSSRRRANGPLSREERARRRQQAPIDRAAGGGGGAGSGSGARGRGRPRGSGRGGGGGGGVVSRLSSEEEEVEDDDDDDDDEEEGPRRRGRPRKKGKGKGRARGRPRGGGRGGGGRDGSLPVVPDEFNTAVAAADSDEEVEQWGAEVGRGGRSSRGAERAAAAAAVAAAGGVLKVDRAGLECALCHNGNSRGMPLPGRAVGPNPLMDGANQLWVHDGCALYSPMVCRDENTGALCNITSEVCVCDTIDYALMRRVFT